jgi:hypothetical protein
LVLLLAWLTLWPTWTPLPVTVHLRAMAHPDPTLPRNDLRGRYRAARRVFTRSGRTASSLGPRRHLSTVWAAPELRGSVIAARLESLLLAAGIPVGRSTAADQLVLPEVVTRTRPLEAALSLSISPQTAAGFLTSSGATSTAEWSNAGVFRSSWPGTSELALPLDIRRAVTTKSRLATHFSLAGSKWCTA